MLGIMTAIWMALSFYSNERVLTPQVLATLARQSGGMAMTPDQVDTFQRMEWLSYGFLPVMLATRVALTALGPAPLYDASVRRDHLSGSVPRLTMGVQCGGCTECSSRR